MSYLADISLFERFCGSFPCFVWNWGEEPVLSSGTDLSPDMSSSSSLSDIVVQLRSHEYPLGSSILRDYVPVGEDSVKWWEEQLGGASDSQLLHSKAVALSELMDAFLEHKFPVGLSPQGAYTVSEDNSTYVFSYDKLLETLDEIVADAVASAGGIDE